MSAPAGDVADRLERLAVHSPVTGVDPERLWKRGRRRQGRRWAIAVACAVILAGVGALASAPLALLVDSPVADHPESPWVLPDVVRQPSGWAPSFGHAPGRLSVVGVGSRADWVSSRPSLWGMSASNGEARWLDLPWAPSDAPAPVLSADGTTLAFWTSSGEAGERTASSQRVPTELHMRDLMTGDEHVWAPGTGDGLRVSGMAWAGETLWFDAGPYDAAQVGSRRALHAWAWGSDPRDLSELYTGRLDLSDVTQDPRGFVAGSFTHGWRVTSPDVATRVTFDMGGSLSTPSMSPDDRIIAGIKQKRNEQEHDVDRMLLAGNVEDGRANMRRVGPVRAARVLGWRSTTEVIVASASGGAVFSNEAQSRQVDVTDVRDPANFRFTHLLDVEGSALPAFAAHAWSAEVVPAPDAPFAPDPRLVVLLVGFAVVTGTSVWRRVRSRRGHP